MLAKHRNELCGYIAQDFALIDYYSVYDNVCLPLIYSEHKIKKKEQKTRCINALEKVGLLNKMNSKACDLSGGQRQRVAIARAIINNPSIIFADEPTGALDSKTSETIFELLNELVGDNKTLILVTHNEYLAQKCDHQIIMMDGKII